MSAFERESTALLAALEGRPVSWADVHENYDLKKGTAGSANHRLGSNPAWGLDAFRRKDMRVVEDVLDWSTWLVTQPLHENEGLTPHPAYRTRIDTGTRGLALLAELAQRDQLALALNGRGAASVGWSLLGAAAGHALTINDLDPKPVNVPHVLVGDGAPLSVGGGPHPAPVIGCAGKRGAVREDPPGAGGHFGPFQGLNDLHLSVLVAQALGLDYDGKRFAGQKRSFEAIRRRSNMPDWGLTDLQIDVASSYLRFTQDATLARQVHAWTLSCLPVNPTTVVRRASGAMEFVCRHAHKSSTGTLAVYVIDGNGVRYIGTPDDGQRGGDASSHLHMQELETLEEPTLWLSRWVAEPDRMVRVPRPSLADAVAWRVDSLGSSQSNFTAGSGGAPVPIPPGPTPQPPQPPVGDESLRLIDLGPAGPGERLYGSRNQRLILREIHGDAASGYVKRWISQEG